jgi:hypothetical protein
LRTVSVTQVKGGPSSICSSLSDSVTNFRHLSRFSSDKGTDFKCSLVKEQQEVLYRSDVSWDWGHAVLSFLYRTDLDSKQITKSLRAATVRWLKKLDRPDFVRICSDRRLLSRTRCWLGVLVEHSKSHPRSRRQSAVDELRRVAENLETVVDRIEVPETWAGKLRDRREEYAPWKSVMRGQPG